MEPSVGMMSQVTFHGGTLYQAILSNNGFPSTALMVSALT